MLVSLGQQHETSGDPIDLLLACHARIRHFHGLVRLLCDAVNPSDADVVDGATRVKRYFEIALPLHAKDEEESILPRLSGIDEPVDSALAVMSAEHHIIDEHLALLLRACDSLAAEPRRLADVRGHLGPLAVSLEKLWQRHLGNEEANIFPALRQLAPAERAAIVTEMRRRRA